MIRKLICKIFGHNYILIVVKTVINDGIEEVTGHTYECSMCKDTFDW